MTTEPHRGLLLRSPALKEAEHWIASRPGGAPAPIEDTRKCLLQVWLSPANLDRHRRAALRH